MKLLSFLCAMYFIAYSNICVCALSPIPCISYHACTDKPLCQIYPSQNMCELQQEIPQQLQNLSYAVYPSVLRYYLDRFNYNKRFNIFPHAIIKPTNEDQLINAVNYLRTNNEPFSIRSGGHCSEPGSLSAGYVIDLENFNTVRFNPNGTLFVGAGCRLGGIIEFLARSGQAIPTGTCGSNGVGGLTLGGGQGFLARKFGLTCDALQSIRILTAQNGLITVDDQNYSDLFWALRGAGNGSFGIVTGYTFNVSFVPFVSLVQLDWDWDSAPVLEIVQAWQNWLATIPDEITTELDFDYLNGTRTISITSVKVGNELQTEWQSAFASLNPRVTINRTMPYIEAAQIEGGDTTYPFIKTKSKMLFSPLSDAGIQVIIDFFDALFAANKQLSVHLELDSAGGESARHDTAYFPRDALAWFYMHMRWKDQNQEADALALINDFYTDISPFTSAYSYANIADYDLGSTYLNAYYGTNVAELIQIKNKYDPQNLFQWEQSIPLM